jgi:CBS domain-containing protein
MRAGDLVAPYPAVRLSTPMIEAARLMAGENLPGLIVLDERDRPLTVLAGTRVLRMALPRYCVEDPALARVVDEAAADVFLRGLGERTVADSLGDERRELAVVEPDATVLEIAALMAGTRTPLVAVVDAGGVFAGGITLDALLDRMLAS